jgi:hypothetical protein
MNSGEPVLVEAAARCPRLGMRLRVRVQGRERAGHRVVCCLPRVLGVAGLAQLPDQPAVLAPRLHLGEPRPARRRAVLGLVWRALGGRLDFIEDRDNSSSSA